MDNMKSAEEVGADIDELLECDSDKKKGLKLRKKRKKWTTFLLLVVIVIIMLVMGAMFAFFFYKSKGKENLKAKEQYITYNGKQFKYREELVNILCLGIDKDVPIAHKEAKRGNIGMSDAIMLVSVDTKRHDVSIIAIPRDTMTDVQRTTVDGDLSSKERLQVCTQYAYGVSMQQSNKLTVDTVSRLLYNTQIQRCCAINYEALPVLNDAIGGVDVEVLEDIEEWEPRLPYGETVHLEGDLAMRFVQTRNKNILEGAALRTQRQKQYVFAFVEKAKSVIKTNPTLPITIFQELQKEGNMCTDITAEDIAYLMPEVLKLSFSDDMVQMLPGESVVGEDGYTEYRMDVDAVKKIIVDTFYEEVE